MFALSFGASSVFYFNKCVLRILICCNMSKLKLTKTYPEVITPSWPVSPDKNAIPLKFELHSLLSLMPQTIIAVNAHLLLYAGSSNIQLT